MPTRGGTSTICILWETLHGDKPATKTPLRLEQMSARSESGWWTAVRTPRCIPPTDKEHLHNPRSKVNTFPGSEATSLCVSNWKRKSYDAGHVITTRCRCKIFIGHEFLTPFAARTLSEAVNCVFRDFLGAPPRDRFVNPWQALDGMPDTDTPFLREGDEPCSRRVWRCDRWLTTACRFCSSYTIVIRYRHIYAAENAGGTVKATYYVLQATAPKSGQQTVVELKSICQCIHARRAYIPDKHECMLTQIQMTYKHGEPLLTDWLIVKMCYILICIYSMWTVN